ncbi:carbohydrate kinase [Mycobacterium sp. GA-1841]|nr:carbohydrate kinase [Mycobacterium sp. GA-1841]
MTVLGNLAIDVIDGAAPSPGGCASFAGLALRAAGVRGQIVAMGGDHDLFDPLLTTLGSTMRILRSEATSAFRLDYDDTDHRRLSVEAIGPVWSTEDIAAADPQTTWVHLAPLLRTDFPGAALAALKARGHRISYDGQGLVRADRLGPLVEDRRFPSDLLNNIDILKLAEEEAVTIAGGTFDAAVAERLGVPEILVTYGSEGCDIYLEDRVCRVPAAWPVLGVQTTGAGDMFTTCYVARRAIGAMPLDAAEFASRVVAGELDMRVRADGAPDQRETHDPGYA